MLLFSCFCTRERIRTANKVFPCYSTSTVLTKSVNYTQLILANLSSEYCINFKFHMTAERSTFSKHSKSIVQTCICLILLLCKHLHRKKSYLEKVKLSRSVFPEWLNRYFILSTISLVLQSNKHIRKCTPKILLCDTVSW